MASVMATTMRGAGVVLVVGLLCFSPVDAAGDTRGDLTPNQLTDGRTLTEDEALAACGPAAAVAFARVMGHAVTLDAAVGLARQVGWTAAGGMAGPHSLLALLQRIGISATLDPGIDAAKIVREVQAGRPVIVRMVGQGGHYLVAERYDSGSSRFDFGQSAIALKRSNGNRWFSLGEIATLGAGAPSEAIYLQGSTPRNMLSAAWRPGAAMPPVRGPAQAVIGQRMVDGGGLGARLRAAPSTEASVVALLSDGSRVTDLGPEVAAGGRLWRRVQAPGGSVAWIAAELLLPAGR